MSNVPRKISIYNRRKLKITRSTHLCRYLHVPSPYAPCAPAPHALINNGTAQVRAPRVFVLKAALFCSRSNLSAPSDHVRHVPVPETQAPQNPCQRPKSQVPDTSHIGPIRLICLIGLSPSPNSSTPAPKKSMSHTF